ncbi:thioredoxin-like negative regulator of GroEL [Catenulispora sp. EB89]|uniref:hypothetical protein n=1 Tax=Catenulispora sp. EB89 TaxID=3156257 RepID=UPI0035195687
MDASELRRRSARGAGGIPPALVTLLIRLGHTDVVLRHAAAGDWNCASAWAAAAVERGEADAAVEMLLPFADAGVWSVTDLTARTLAAAGRVDEALALARALPDDPEKAAILEHTALKLQADLLVAHGRRHEAFELLLPYAGHWKLTAAWITAAEGLGRDAEVAERLIATAAGPSGAKTEDLAEALIRSGRAAEAEKALRRRVMINDLVYTGPLRKLVDLLVVQGRENAVRELIAGPAGRWAAVRFAEILENRGDRDAALATLAPFGTVDHDRQLAYGEMLLRAGRLEEATEVLAALDSGPVPGLGLHALCRALAKHGRHTEALALIDDVADRAGGMTMGLLTLRATALADRDGVDQAIAELRAHPGGDGDATAAAFHSALLLSRARRWEDAVGVLAPLSGRLRWASLKCAEALLRLGRIEEGIELALKWEPPKRDLTA